MDMVVGMIVSFFLLIRVLYFFQKKRKEKKKMLGKNHSMFFWLYGKEINRIEFIH